MHREQNRIMRETIMCGALVSVGAVILSALQFRVAPWSVVLGVAFAVLAVKFYGALVLLLFNENGARFQFGVWLLLKIAALFVLVVVAMKSSTGELFSFIAGTLVFIPAAFRYALAEAAKGGQGEMPPDSDESNRS